MIFIDCQNASHEPRHGKSTLIGDWRQAARAGSHDIHPLKEDHYAKKHLTRSKGNLPRKMICSCCIYCKLQGMKEKRSKRKHLKTAIAGGKMGARDDDLDGDDGVEADERIDRDEFYASEQEDRE
ncbi:hypothetical protein V494_04806 [Pseudogymnoascus sp. VKM F-4513 (FW-928)]|nr:hypothetical protein V494_04806 [Pseudogymnoascus sp. VKM F-4513 (FW-928)]